MTSNEVDFRYENEQSNALGLVIIIEICENF